MVRHCKVKAALDWLKLNHQDYADLEISEENLKQYPEDKPPVIIDWHKSDIFAEKESTAVTPHREEEVGVESGECPFMVHGITVKTVQKRYRDSVKDKQIVCRGSECTTRGLGRVRHEHYTGGE